MEDYKKAMAMAERRLKLALGYSMGKPRAWAEFGWPSTYVDGNGVTRAAHALELPLAVQIMGK